MAIGETRKFQAEETTTKAAMRHGFNDSVQH